MIMNLICILRKTNKSMQWKAEDGQWRWDYVWVIKETVSAYGTLML